MSLYMRAVLRDWHDPPFEELATFMAERSAFAVRGLADDGWHEFEAVNEEGVVVLAADLTRGGASREELEELQEFLDELEGPEAARDAVKVQLRNADAVVGMQVLPSVHEQSVAAANSIIDYLEQRPGVLTQVDTVGWYDGPELILSEPE